MTADITFRPATLDDLEPLAELYTHHWCNYLPDPQDKLLAGRYNVAIQLVRSPLTVIAEREGKVVGVCLGCVTSEGRAPVVDAWVPIYEDLRVLALERLEAAGEDPEGIVDGSLFGDQRELAKADDFISQGSLYAEAQVNLIMVEPWLKGVRLGSRLLEHMNTLMREAGARHFFLMTDTSSDYTYYDHRGMHCIATYPDDPNDPESWAALMYGGDIA